MQMATEKAREVGIAQARRLESLQRCVQELNSRVAVETKGIQRCCQMIRLWKVSPKKRSVEPGDKLLTYMNGIGPKDLTFLVQRPLDDRFFVAEILANDSVKARFLIKIIETNPAIRGLYSVTTEILDRVPASPGGVVFHRSHFA